MITVWLAYLLSLIPVVHVGREGIAMIARQISLGLVGVIIMTSIRLVLRGVARVRPPSLPHPSRCRTCVSLLTPYVCLGVARDEPQPRCVADAAHARAVDGAPLPPHYLLSLQSNTSF